MNKLPYCEAICRDTYRGITTETNCKNYARHTWQGAHVCKVHLNFYKRLAEKRLDDLTLSSLLKRAHGIGGRGMTHKLDAAVFVFRHKETQQIAARYIETARELENNNEWKHVATLEPRMWIECHYNDALKTKD